MSFEPPAGILDIGNATLRVGKLEVAETSGLNQGLQNIVKNDLLITETTEYTTNRTWGLKLPTAWVGEFEVKGQTSKYVEFNFYNEGSTSNALGYTLNFKDTSLSLMYDTSLSENRNILTTATIPTIVGTYRKVNIFFERGVIAVSIDGARVLYFKESDTYNQIGVASRVVSTTGGAFLNAFFESDHGGNSGFKNLRIVNGRFISDKTSNVSFIGSLGVGVNSPKESLDIRGNMHLTRVSNVSQVSVDSNVVTEYTGPHDRPLRKYPEVAMTSATTGGYTVTHSGTPYPGGYEGWRAFDEVSTTEWITDQTARYNTTTPFDANSPSTDGLSGISGVSGTRAGSWVKLELPKKIRLQKTEIFRRDVSDQRFDQAYVYGSNDDTNWYQLSSITNPTYGQPANASGDMGPSIISHSTDSTTFYKYFVIQITSLVDNVGTANIGQAYFYGYEEGSGSLDTTLKTVYNVPATTGTQLEVYYDGRETSSYSGSGTTVNDISPNTNNGTLNGGVGFDSTYKAFTFNASSSQRITSTIDTSYWGTNKLHSVAFWFKADRIDGKYNIFHIGNPSNNESSGFWISDGRADNNAGNSLNWWFYNADSTTKVSTFSWTLNTWYHIALTFDGSTKKMYVNGHHIDFSVGNVITTLPTGIPNSASLAVGSTTNSVDYFDGSIANFRVYGAKTLNADQVKELYDYQKDYFLGSKSQVTLYKGHLGVGVTEPSGQLELAGDERIQEYPPRDLSDFETMIEGEGTYKVSSSNDVTNPAVGTYDHPATAFTANISFFRGVSAIYDDSSVPALYTGTHFTNGIGGDFIQIELPHKIYLKSINITTRTDGSVYYDRGPHTGFIFGSNNGGTTWSQVASWTGLNWTLGESKPIQINSNALYSTYRLVANKISNNVGSATRFNIDRWQLFGTPGPTTLNKGSLSLTRSLDVPRVSRYDVDTETPRYEKLLVDFDTTVNNSPIDISGKGNHGAFYNGASYSAADKAFKFVGVDNFLQAPNSSDTVRGTHGLSGTQPVHSQSVWFKQTTDAGDYTWVCAVGTADLYQQSAVLLSGNSGLTNRITFDNYNGWVTSTVTAELNRWYHVVVTYNGGGNWNTTNCRIYVDGVDCTGPSSETYNEQPLNLQGSILALGSTNTGTRGLTGLVSNYKLYNVVLEPSEVRKLYNLGRTGRSMVISDTAVGIGKVPEAQLDVRGSLAVSGNFNGNSSIKFFRFTYQMPNSTNTQYLRRSGASTNGVNYNSYFTSDYNDTRILSITSTAYNTNGDAVIGQGSDTSWLHTIYSVPGSSGSSDAGLVIYNIGAACVEKRIEIIVITY